MANTITSTYQLSGTKEAIVHIALASDGTNETGTVVYDSSVVATAAGNSDTLTSDILEVWASTGTASTARIKLLFDADTDVLALNIPQVGQFHQCFEQFRGIKNSGGAGKTGDILLTTTGLASGDSIHIVLRVKRI